MGRRRGRARRARTAPGASNFLANVIPNGNAVPHGGVRGGRGAAAPAPLFSFLTPSATPYNSRVERKLATVLFVDLVSSTDLVAGTDPEVVRRRVNRFF